VSIVTPQGGDIWRPGEVRRVSWETSLDHGHTRSAMVVFKPEGGKTLQLRRYVTESYIDVSVSELPRGDRAQFIVYVSDGVNTGRAVSHQFRGE